MIVNFPNLIEMCALDHEGVPWWYDAAVAHAAHGNYDAAVCALSIASWRAGIECDSWSS